MATSWELAQVAAEREWQARVAYWRLESALDVMAEAGSTANHAERVAYAVSILADPLTNILSFGTGVLTNDTIRATLDFEAGAPGWGIDDAAIEFTVESIYNAYAGVSEPAV